jgi:hypothetical protein
MSKFLVTSVISSIIHSPGTFAWSVRLLLGHVRIRCAVAFIPEGHCKAARRVAATSIPLVAWRCFPSK